MAGSNYRGNAGDSVPYRGQFREMRPDHGIAGYTFPTRGVITNGLYELLDIGALSDGTSNTIILSEAAISPEFGEMTSAIRGGVARINVSSQVAGVAATCDAQRNGTQLSSSTLYTSQQGGRWADGYVSYTGFYTILPPNSPTCYFDSTHGSDNTLAAANSYHTGGVNVCFGDGAVKFVPDSINAVSSGVTLSTQPTRGFTGESPFGVWGALGTRNGGEAKSL